MNWLAQIALWRVACLVPVLAIVSGCADGANYRVMQGETMGTYYRIQYAHTSSCQPSQFTVDRQLVAFNRSLSTYIADSELSRINSAPAGDIATTSERLQHALAAAQRLWRDSGGAFDVTVGPLVNLWGFGAEKPQRWPPSKQAQAAAAESVGMQQLTLLPDGALRKHHANTYIDLSAIAKGQAVDEVSESLLALGCLDFLVDIGGEVRSAGVNRQQKLWRVGIEIPDPRQVGSVQRVLQMTDNSVATSGDYRNFREFQGKRVDHVIDPRSGQPADNSVLSVTVVHHSAMWADAYATALMVLGADEGLAFATERQIPVLMLLKSPTGEVVERYTPDLQAFLLNDAE